MAERKRPEQDAPLISGGGQDFAGEDERLRRAADPSHRSRAAERDDTHEDEGLASSPQERRRSFRDEWTQEALPKIPIRMDGWHMCWLSTTNQWDPIERRMRMGYVPVKAEEIPGFEHLSQKSGQWEGMVGINEMILFKIPEQIYRQVMTEFHHEQPIDEESAIKERMEEGNEGLTDRSGKSLVTLEEDTRDLGRRPKRAPTFS